MKAIHFVILGLLFGALLSACGASSSAGGSGPDRAACTSLHAYSVAVGKSKGRPPEASHERLYSDLRTAAREASNPAVRALAMGIVTNVVPSSTQVARNAAARCAAIGEGFGVFTPSVPAN